MKVGIITVSNSEIISSEKNDSIKLICSQLYKNGFDVVSNQTLKLESQVVTSALNQTKQVADCIIFISDTEFEKSYVCKKMICDCFKTKLANSAFAKKNIDDFSRVQNIPLRKEDATYYQLPEIARCIKNPLGVFQGFLLESENKTLFFLPLTHNELHHMFFSSVLPYIMQKPSCSTYVFKTFGLKYNEMVLMLKDFIKNKHNISVVCNEYLLNGEILLSVPTSVKNGVAENFIASVYSKILPYIYSDADKNLPEMVFDLLSVTKKKIVFAEDFTAGKMATSFFEGLSNASDVLLESYVVPNNNSKIKVLGVESNVFKKSVLDMGEVAYQMALGALENSGADIVVSNCGDLNAGEITFAIGNDEGIHIYTEKVFGSLEQKIAMAASVIFFKLVKKIKQNDFHLGQTTV